MSLATPIIDLTDGSVDHDYDRQYLTNQNNGFGSHWRGVSSTLNIEESLDIAHQRLGTGQNEVQRSKVGFAIDVEDADGNRGVIQVYAVFSFPVRIATEANVLKVSSQLVDFLNTGTNAAEIVRQST